MVILFSSAVCGLFELGLKFEVLTPPTVINPLWVSINSEGKPRLILDLRHVNSYIPKAKLYSGWKIGRFSSNTCRGVVSCTNLIWNRDTTTLTSVSPIISSWVFSGPWVVLEADILFNCLTFWAFVCALPVYQVFPPVSTLLERLTYSFSSLFRWRSWLWKRFSLDTALFQHCSVWFGQSEFGA